MAEAKSNIVCSCAFAKLAKATPVLSAAAFARDAGEPLMLADDICRMAAEDRASLADFCSGRKVRVFGCRPRAMKALFAYARVDAEFEFYDIVNDYGRVARELGFRGEAREPLPRPLGAWSPWYPLIDAARCINCGKCADFCVFGVYGKSDGNVFVKNPRSCKDNCPACARMCPVAAIIFPKCPEDFISGADALPQKGAEDSGDFYEALRLRRAAAKKLFKRGGDEA